MEFNYLEKVGAVNHKVLARLHLVVKCRNVGEKITRSKHIQDIPLTHAHSLDAHIN